MGRWGLMLREIVMGAWLTFGDQVDEDLAERILRTAYDRGVNYFDNADAFGRGRGEQVMQGCRARRWSSRAGRSSSVAGSSFLR